VDVTVDTRTHRVTLGSTVVHLARKEFMVLAYLLRNRGSLVTRDMLLEHVWSREVDPSSNTVTAHIRSLRL
jgi:DNA-binding response OmpR family regulator